MISTDLKAKAACKGQDTGIFYADIGPMSNKTVRASVSKARALCKSCEIQAECLMNAVNKNEEFGIWGGLTAKERRAIFEENKEITYEHALDIVLWTRNT